DPAGRLTRAVYSDGTTIDYTYDAAGNLLRREVDGGAPLVSRAAAWDPGVGALIQGLEGVAGEASFTHGEISSCRLAPLFEPPDEALWHAESGEVRGL
ncbi:MAG TPA: RHS repeat domain-containing protein, partial [Thermoanaerobaculia bacterium]|nr:RHS repeat domain-containing protein [Thermoanaerobaculia bacterium]